MRWQPKNDGLPLGMCGCPGYWKLDAEGRYVSGELCGCRAEWARLHGWIFNSSTGLYEPMRRR